MKKIEMIWREILFQTIEKSNHQFTQKELARTLGVSTSTIFQALKSLRRIGAVRVTGRFFIVEDTEKILYHWASIRDLQKDIIFKGRVNLPVFEIEGMMPANVVFGSYSAARHILGDVPADYDTVYVYAEDLDHIRSRFEFRKGRSNLTVLKADKLVLRYGLKTTLAQTFVDLWNVSDWQAKDFTHALKDKIDELLS